MFVSDGDVRDEDNLPLEDDLPSEMILPSSAMGVE